MPAPVVTTRTGVVGGADANGVEVFRGIPYASPPVGALRFAAPVAHDPWPGVWDATGFGPPPPQAVRSTDTDEWLTVNVWTPSTASAHLPVLVWLYGGRFTGGSSDLPEYDGARLAAGGVVVVSLNYRVGVEGYLLIDGAPPNRGLLDQIAALRWVRDNVSSFGGDPGNVTVFGESAGAASVALILTAPSGAGLARRGIAQSVPAVLFGLDLAGDVAHAIAGRLGLRPALGDLASVPASELVDAATDVEATAVEQGERWGYDRMVRGSIFGPVVDGTIVTASPWRALAAGAARDVDLLVGHNRDEYNLLIAAAGGAHTITQADSDRALRSLPPRPGAAEDYRLAFPGADHVELYQLVCSDFVYRMPSLHLAQAHASAGGTTYLYEFLCDATPIGAAHTVEIPAVFGTLDSPLGVGFFGPTPGPEVEALAHQMRRAWRSFATHGDPGWAPYDPERQLTRLFGAQPSVARYPERASQAIWSGHHFDPFRLHAPARRRPR